jgi:hypothetical protein
MRVSSKSLLLLLSALLSPISVVAITPSTYFNSSTVTAGDPPQAETLQEISPKSAYVYIGEEQRFTSAGATKWTATQGAISTTGVYKAPDSLPKNPLVTVTATGPGGSVSATVRIVDGVKQAIAPATVKLDLGAKQVFISSGGTLWTAEYGKITSTGVYVAPTVYPTGGKDTVTVMGSHGSATAEITLVLPTPVITGVGTNTKIPLGLFSVNVTGTGFSSYSQVKLNGSLLNSTYAEGVLKITGFVDKAGPATITVVNGPVESKPFEVYLGLPNALATPAAARRLLEQAAFGPTPTDAAHVQTVGLQGWLNEQFAMPQISNYNAPLPTQGGMPRLFMANAVTNPDQLRQRVAFALSQIFVTSLEKLNWNENMIGYQNMLLEHAFGNYRQLMEDVTLSPAMGEFLDMANNAKADPNIGSVANENYARELMQLFTIGTDMLNEDGTLQMDSNNQPIPTYTQFQVTEFARVYTGWTYTPPRGKAVSFWEPISSGPLVSYAPQHDFGSKQLLNGYVSPANISPTEDLQNALNNIFNHPNVGPFVSKQLIQHLVKSNPSPAYVKRVASVFNNNGHNERGDLRAVVNAILMDPEARANDDGEDDPQPNDGHLQEPALYIAGMIRAFGGKMTSDNNYTWDLANMGQDIFDPATVFNYYQPDFGVPGTDLVGGEFEIHTPNNAIFRANEVSNLFSQWSNPIQNNGPGTTVDLTGFLPLANNPAQLVNALDFTLTHGTMPAAMKEPIITAVTAETGGQLRRVQRGIYLILTSNFYNVWH